MDIAQVPAIQPSSGFDLLINEELSNIFSFLSPTQRQKVRRVCRSWASVIDTCFGMAIRIKNSTSDLVTSCPFATTVELYSMTLSFPPESISFAISKSIRSLTFSNILVSYNLLAFLRACADSIRHLSFSNVILDLPLNDRWSPISDESIQISLPYLTRIEIKAFTLIDGILELLIFITLRTLTPNLSELIVNVQNPPVIPYQLLFTRDFNDGTTHPLIKLAAKCRASLRQFVVGRTGAPTKFEFRAPNLEFLPLLEGLEIHPYFREEWAPILRNQNGIKRLNLGSCNVSRWPEIQDCIVLNSKSLEEFTIGGLSFGQIWDCGIFSGCSELNSLAIEISHSNKVNLRSLPLTLKSLSLFGPLPKFEIEAIAGSLVGLERLKFTHLGRMAEFVEEEQVSLELFKTLLQLPNLKLLSFVTCSSVSIDWDFISRWCACADSSPGFNYSEKFFTTHGEYFRNGIIVELGPNFERGTFDWDSLPLFELESNAASEIDIENPGDVDGVNDE